MKSNIKRIVALIGVILIAISFIATLVVAMVNFPGSDKVFVALIGCDIIIPAMLWLYIMLYQFAKRRDDDFEKRAKDEINK